MIDTQAYVARRQALCENLASGLVLLPGHGESPMNYAGNTYPFWQDTSFLYFAGVDVPGRVLIIDVDTGESTLYGNDLTVEDIVWVGPHPTVGDEASAAGIEATAPLGKLATAIGAARKSGRTVHYLPPNRAETTLQLADLLECAPSEIAAGVSEALIRAVVALRAIKSAGEIAEMEQALSISHEMYAAAMRLTRPGVFEREVVAEMQAIAFKHGARPAYPIIFSIHGETLHNHHYGNAMQDGDLVLCDAGAESSSHYASDLTRVFPVSGKFSERQLALYSIVLRAQEAAIGAAQPGTPFKDLHYIAARHITEGLKDLGLMRGSVDDAVAEGAHALFYPHGLGHMIGLDVHDMEGLGEDYVGYDDTVRRSTQFGTAYLRLARALEPGFVVTVEPGIYFIPELIGLWGGEKRHAAFIDYGRVQEFADAGGYRVEDDVLIEIDGHRILGKPVPKTPEAIEAFMAD